MTSRTTSLTDLPSHDHPENPEWSKAAAAELYAALMETCSPHSRRDKYEDLLKK
jgi:hypothetical protein